MQPERSEIPPTAAENIPPVVLIAASAGGIAAITAIIRALPRDFPAAVVILQHRPAWGQSKLTELLAGRTELPLIDATSGEAMKAGTIYLARPHEHLTISHSGTFRYVDGTRIRHLWSSANPLFASAAQVFGPKAVAVVLTGSGMDATDGVQSIKAHGGK